MFFKSNIKKLKRIQTSLNRDLEKGIVLDRNERVDYFDQKTFSKITKNIGYIVFQNIQQKLLKLILIKF